MRIKSYKKSIPLKQKLISRGKGVPGIKEGRDGDLQIRSLEGQGIFLFYKWYNKWYSSRLSIYVPTTRSEKKDPVYLPVGVTPSYVGEVAYDSSGVVKLAKGKGKTSQILSINKDKILDATELHLSRTDTTDMDDDTAKNSEFLFTNTGHCHLRLISLPSSTGAQYDAFMSFGRRHPEDPWNMRRWVCGYDTSAGDFVIGYKSASSNPTSTDTIDTPSSTGFSQSFKFHNAGGISFTGILHEASIDTDKFLCWNHGTADIKYRTGAEILSDIGAGTSSVGALDDLSDVTYDSGDLTISSLDKIISGDLSFESSGKILVDKNSTATSSSTNTAMQVDFDQTGISGAAQALNNIGLDVDMNCDSVTHVGVMYQTGLDVDVVGTTTGTQVGVGADINVDGADVNVGLQVTTQDVHMKLVNSDGGKTGSIYLDSDGNLMLAASSEIIVDKNTVNTVTATNTAMQIDFDHTGISASGQTIANVGLDLDMNCESVTHVGTVGQTGIDIDMVAATDGAQTQVGINIDVSGADINTGMIIDAGGGAHLKLVNASSFCSLSTISNRGATTLSTFDDSGSDSGSITLQADGAIIFVPSSGGVYIRESADASGDKVDYGQIWVHDDTPNTLWFTTDAGDDIQITNGTSLAATPKHYMDWFYTAANLATQDSFYMETMNDEYGVSSSINTDLSSSGYSTTTLNSAWRMVRDARRIPYTGTITQFTVFCESTGAAADSDVEVALWWADALADDTEHSSTANFTCDHICTLTFDFSGASRWMTKKTTSFNATAITEHDWFFVTLRKITSGDGSYFNVHSTVTWDGA